MTYLRHLHLTSPLMHGEDVRQLQRALGITADGQYGTVTARAVHYRKLLLGFPTRNLDGAGPWFQEILYGHSKLPAAYTARATARAQVRRAAHLAAQRSASPRHKAADWLVARAGRTELAPGHGYGSNRNPHWLDGWQVANGHSRFASAHEDGWPWCGVAAWAGYKWGAGIVLPGEIRSTEWLYWTAKAGTHGFRAIPLSQVDKGDLLLMFAIGVHVAMARTAYHGGNLQTIEGNTSFGDGGSQDNGGALAKRERLPSQVVLAVRVGN